MIVVKIISITFVPICHVFGSAAVMTTDVVTTTAWSLRGVVVVELRRCWRRRRGGGEMVTLRVVEGKRQVERRKLIPKYNVNWAKDEKMTVTPFSQKNDDAGG